MSKADFERSKFKLSHLSLNTILLAERILVDGMIPAAAAKEVGMSRQNVSKAMQRVRRALSAIPDGWVRVECWAPQDLAAEFLDKVNARNG
jgi:hypothetical protein